MNRLEEQCFRGLHKTSVVDFPGKVACVLFTGGCSFRCPYCYNISLVEQTAAELSWQEVWHFLGRRKNVLQGLVISGGEPTLAPYLLEFLPLARKLGYLVKLDTNGYNPQPLEYLLANGLIDYVAMDIKNSPRKYAGTCGLTALDLTRITNSIRVIKDSGVNYEFRTTVAAELHNPDDFAAILRFTGGGARYIIQPFHDSPTLSGLKFSSPPPNDLSEMVTILEQRFTDVMIRT